MSHAWRCPMHGLLSAAGEGRLKQVHRSTTFMQGMTTQVATLVCSRVLTQSQQRASCVRAYVAKMPRAPRCCRARAMAAKMPPPADASVPLPSSSTSTRVPAVAHSSTRLRHVQRQAASVPGAES